MRSSAGVSADNFVILRRYEDKEEVLARQQTVDAAITDFMHKSRYKQTLPVCCGICCLEDAPGDLVIDNILDRAQFRAQDGQKRRLCQICLL